MTLVLIPENEENLKKQLTQATQKIFKDVKPTIRVLIRSRMIHFNFSYHGTVWFKELNKLKKEISKLSVSATDFGTFKEAHDFKLRAPPNLLSVTATGNGYVRISIMIHLDEKEDP